MNRQLHEFGFDPRETKPVDSGDDEIDISVLLRTLWRRKWVILLCALMGLAIGVYHARNGVAPLYEATTTLTLEAVSDPVVDFQNVSGGFFGDDAAIITETEVIRSRILLGKLVDSLDLTNHPYFNPALRPPAEQTPVRDAINDAKATVLSFLRPIDPSPSTGSTISVERNLREDAISSLAGIIEVANIEWSYVLTLTAVTEDPFLSADLVNNLAELYVRDRIDVKFDKARQSTEWLTNRVADLRVDVENSANRLKQFRADADLVSEDALIGMNLRLKDQRDRLAEAEVSETTIATRQQSLIRALDTQDFETIVSISGDPTLRRLLSQISGGDLGATRLFEARTVQLIDETRRSAVRNVEQREVLRRAIADQEVDILRQSSELVQIQELEREAEADRQLYEYFLSRMKETSVQQGLQQTDARIISPAVVPNTPFNPNSNRAIILGLLVGAIVGMGYILLRESMVTTFRAADELEAATNLPVLGQIPRIPGRTRQAQAKYLARKPSSAPVEAVRNLRTSLVLSQDSAPPQVIMITSAAPGEGKSTSSIALAENYAGLGKRVLLIEGDIRRRTLARFVGLRSVSYSLLDVLNGEASIESAAVSHPIVGFDMILGAAAKANPADLLSSNAMANMITEARRSYDIIILDTPPLLVVPDARILGQFADSILCVVQWNQTAQAQVLEALKELRAIGLKASGLVLTNIDTSVMRQMGYGSRYSVYDRRIGRSYYKA